MAKTPEELKAQYEAVWDTFTRSVTGLIEEVETAIEGGEPVHPVLLALWDVPYYKAKDLILQVGATKTRSNPGSLTGLFFERLAGAAVRSFLGMQKPELTFYVGRGGPGYPTELPRDPDLCVARGSKLIVFEFKSAPKKGDLESIERLRAEYSAMGVPYFFVGGEPSGTRNHLATLSSQGWVAFLTASERNADAIQAANVDSVLRAAVACL